MFYAESIGTRYQRRWEQRTVDLDAEGNVLGVEFVSFEDFAEVMESAHGILELPENMGSGVLWSMSDSPSSEETAARQRLRRDRTPRVE